MDAIWKTIPSAPNYEVSNLGQVQAIRAACSVGESATSVAARFGITDANVGCIVKRKTWAHV